MTENNYHLGNEKVMVSDVATSLIEEYFACYFPKHKLIRNYHNPSGYRGVRYEYNTDEIFISSGRGYLDLELKVSGKNINVDEVFPELSKMKTSSKTNILFL